MLLLERGLEVDHGTVNRWGLADTPLIERRPRSFRKPHRGPIRVDETCVRIRGAWRDLDPASDEQGEAVGVLLTAGAAVARPHRPGPGSDLPGCCRGGPEGGPAGTRSRPPRDEAPPAGDRERPFPAEEEHVARGRLPELQYGATIHPGGRGHDVDAQGFRLRQPMDDRRAEPDGRALLRFGVSKVNEAESQGRPDPGCNPLGSSRRARGHGACAQRSRPSSLT